MVELIGGAVFGFLGGAAYGVLTYAKRLMQDNEDFDVVKIGKSVFTTTVIGGLAGLVNLPIDAMSTMSVAVFAQLCIDRLWSIFTAKTS